MRNLTDDMRWLAIKSKAVPVPELLASRLGATAWRISGLAARASCYVRIR
jgi:hypothetical protein